ncbi:MAG: hypothetical protein GXY17_01380 [Clostridiaceae bacterium]|nr:hypothetical protein [Clostridiaceae bacterium]
MRYKRKEHFKRMRHKKAINIFLYTLVMPSIVILLGYLVACVIILPYMSK